MPPALSVFLGSQSPYFRDRSFCFAPPAHLFLLFVNVVLLLLQIPSGRCSPHGHLEFLFWLGSLANALRELTTSKPFLKTYTFALCCFQIDDVSYCPPVIVIFSPDFLVWLETVETHYLVLKRKWETRKEQSYSCFSGFHQVLMTTRVTTTHIYMITIQKWFWNGLDQHNDVLSMMSCSS